MDVYHREQFEPLNSTAAGYEFLEGAGLLRCCSAFEAYCNAYTADFTPERITEFLLLNPTFPQSVRYSLGAAWNALESIAQSTDEGSGPPVRALGMLRARLEHASVDEVLDYGLEEFLEYKSLQLKG